MNLDSYETFLIILIYNIIYVIPGAYDSAFHYDVIEKLITVVIILGLLYGIHV